MSLRHALLVSLLDGEATGYELAKRFNIVTANYWHAQQAQLYAELARLEADGLIEGETVVQSNRPNKRVFDLTDAGREEICRFATEPSELTSIKDGLLVKVAGVDQCDHDAVLADIERRRALCAERLSAYEQTKATILRGRDEVTFVRTARRVGPYLTLLRGIALEAENVAWCDTAARIVAARTRVSPRRGARTA